MGRTHFKYQPVPTARACIAADFEAPARGCLASLFPSLSSSDVDRSKTNSMLCINAFICLKL